MLPVRLAVAVLALHPLSMHALTPQESAMLGSVEPAAPQAISLLERLVNINSGSYNTAGVQTVAEMLEPEFRKLGFSVRLAPGVARQRGPHLIAEHKGSRPGKPLLLIGHMDTVFEPASPFQRFVREGARATGPGVVDMKGGLVIMLAALQALDRNQMLKDAAVTVVLTGDEESVGRPQAEARRDLIEAGKNARAALCFESGNRQSGRDFVSRSRRGSLTWELRVQGNAGHSGSIFSERLGHGAIYEISRIISQFHDQLPEPNLTFSVGLLLGGANIQADAGGAASVSGKANIVPGEALARGDVRGLTLEQVARVKDKMYAIVAKSLPGTKSTLSFREDSYPPMSPTSGNQRLLEQLNAAYRAAGIPEVGELDPMQRGAGDSAFISPYTDTLTGFGAIGSGGHAPGESIDLASLPRLIQRAAWSIYTLTR